IRLQAVSGLKWSSFSQFGRQGMQLVTTIILARLLDPADFGLMGMATVVTGFILLFRDMGTASAVIQRRQSSPALLSGLFWFNVAFGLLAAALLYLLAPLLASFYHEARVTPLLRLLALSFVISGLGTLHQALLERGLEFARLARIEVAATLAGAAVGIGAALSGQGVWSLVYQTLTLTAVTTALLWFFSGWRPGLALGLHEVRQVMSYSLNLTGFNVFNYFARNADYLLIGRYLGATELGYYTLAYRLMLYPLQNISAVVARVMFPVYVRMQDDNARFSRTYLRVAAAVALVTFPLMLGLLALAEPFVLAVFGPSWQPVVLLLQILAPLGIAQAIVPLVGSIYQAKGRTDWMFRWGVVASALFVISFLIGIRWGVIGVALAYAVAFLALSYPAQAIPFRLIGLRVRELMAVLWRPFAISVLMAATVFGFTASIPAGTGSLLTLCLAVLIGITLYTGATLVFNRAQVRDLSALFRNEQGTEDPA
ncbi:MAG: MOP flippase family protein, partial [Desulfuromonadales bacterium]|nr:MOP flippase family protein [Desulfuromonadales bacterium]